MRSEPVESDTMTIHPLETAFRAAGYETQAALSDDSGVSRQMLSDIVTRKTRVGHKTARRLEKALRGHISLGDLLTLNPRLVA